MVQAASYSSNLFPHQLVEDETINFSLLDLVFHLRYCKGARKVSVNDSIQSLHIWETKSRSENSSEGFHQHYLLISALLC